jgi:hypothetical protein
VADETPAAPPPPPAAAPAVVPAAPVPQYEFTRAQSRVIDNLADNIDWVRLAAFLLAALYLVYAVTLIVWAVRDESGTFRPVNTVITYGVLAVVFGFFALFLQRGAAELRKVTSTAGYDITHLMAALRSLSGFFGMIAGMFIGVLALLFVGLIFALVYGY